MTTKNDKTQGAERDANGRSINARKFMMGLSNALPLMNGLLAPPSLVLRNRYQ